MIELLSKGASSSMLLRRSQQGVQIELECDTSGCEQQADATRQLVCGELKEVNAKGTRTIGASSRALTVKAAA